MILDRGTILIQYFFIFMLNLLTACNQAEDENSTQLAGSTLPMKSLIGKTWSQPDKKGQFTVLSDSMIHTAEHACGGFGVISPISFLSDGDIQTSSETRLLPMELSCTIYDSSESIQFPNEKWARFEVKEDQLTITTMNGDEITFLNVIESNQQLADLQECSSTFVAWSDFNLPIVSNISCEQHSQCGRYDYGSLNVDYCYTGHVINTSSLTNELNKTGENHLTNFRENCQHKGIISNSGGVCLVDVRSVLGILCLDKQCQGIYDCNQIKAAEDCSILSDCIWDDNQCLRNQ